jgi:peptidoglycan/xylan/chitin deacetylase (PgdA/CDA1 family)
MNRVRIKRALKQTAGRASAVLAPFVPAPRVPAACILRYHRVARIDVADPWLDTWNVSPDVFERQMAAIAEYADCVRVSDLVGCLSGTVSTGRPVVCLTFDDGFSCFATEVLPVLRRYGLPATAFIVTKYVGTREPMPFDRWGRRHFAHEREEAWRPLGWEEIETSVASGLVEIGGHSHEHRDARDSTASELYEEAGRCRSVLEQQLGARHAAAYSYPYGSTRLGEVPPEYCAAVRSAGFASAVSTDLGLASRESDRFRLPRVEATATDTAATLRAKIHGSLLPLQLTERLRRARRSA